MTNTNTSTVWNAIRTDENGNDETHSTHSTAQDAQDALFQAVHQEWREERLVDGAVVLLHDNDRETQPVWDDEHQAWWSDAHQEWLSVRST